MTDLSTTFMGLKLKNPIIAGSSGLTGNIEEIEDLASKGAGAIILKSLFEEEIIYELEQDMQQMQGRQFVYPETFDYMETTPTKDRIRQYIELIKEAKSRVDIPVIASINCVSDQKWIYLTQEIEKAGADAIELNLFILPSDLSRTADENEKLYYSILKQVKEKTKLPVAVKISYYFSNLASTIKKLSDSGADAITLFNRFYSPDFDIDTFEIIPSNILSHQGELSMSLRWVGMMSGRVDCDIASSTGVYTGQDTIKQLLAGASAVQIVSTLYKNGSVQIKLILKELEQWMEKHNFKTIADFKGKLAQSNTVNPASYERVQFMKHFSQFIKFKK
ncbi:MAG: dihydroorotate dehydrogenase-like protein [Salinivirgaceae bacterium]|nr:dihydroorotate dehydrogenase-like protein [Salinivirgaceae bacterium]MDD4746931.1 dihydroorotate dehydrogenase-like protein [Salinivirgaceae bacterium]MDY0280208.1 dihydroorotate dehydrogenase-like protein [Salinivirgaceae bacterium]